MDKISSTPLGMGCKIRLILTLSFTMDIWTDVENFVGITVHFVTLDFQYKSTVLAAAPITGKHTAENIKLRVESVWRDWGISLSQIACVVIMGQI